MITLTLMMRSKILLLIVFLVAILLIHSSRAQEDDEENFSQPIKTSSPTRALITRHKTQRRDLGLLAIKAILLGPLIGLTIKAALIRGLVWAVLAYGLHLFFPALLSTLGLGTGLVGFARQLQPDYSHVLASYLSNLRLPIPSSFNQMARQYQQVLSPVIDSIRAIPEGHCRYRAVCETASHLARQARSMSTTLQRVSATVYMNFGTDYSKAWLDGVVQSDCATKYNQCTVSPFSMVAARLAQSLGAGQQQALATGQAPLFAAGQQAATGLATSNLLANTATTQLVANQATAV